MAKKTNDKELVDCRQCVSGGTEVVNHLMDCFDKERNPMGYKVGVWLKECKHFKLKR